MEQVITMHFSSPETFARKMKTAYAAVIPALREDRAVCAAFVDAVGRDTRDLVQRYSHGDTLTCSMAMHLVVAYVA